MKRLLIQTQLSNINAKTQLFDLACDSGWQMTINRAREMLRLNPELRIDIMGAHDYYDEQSQVVATPYRVNPDLWARHGSGLGDGRLAYKPHWIVANALETRYDFNMEEVAYALNMKTQHGPSRAPRYDAVYINDPMLLRHFKALFLTRGGYQPKFFVHSHFVDSPGAPKFPQEASLWLGQVEATMRADWNFWQCQSALDEFKAEASKLLLPARVDEVMAKSSAWDDGYSIAEITTPVDRSKMRFTEEAFKAKTKGKTVVFFPNRISPASGDYTNGMRFMFEVLPELRKSRQDFVVIAGNPNQKVTNAELEERCGANGYVSLVPDALNRDEFKFVASHSQVAVGLYNNDTYGGTVARECIELGCLPLWLDCNEYRGIAHAIHSGGLAPYPYMVKRDMSDIVEVTSQLIDYCNSPPSQDWFCWLKRLQDTVRERCSYESTTPAAMERMGLL